MPTTNGRATETTGNDNQPPVGLSDVRNPEIVKAALEAVSLMSDESRALIAQRLRAVSAATRYEATYFCLGTVSFCWRSPDVDRGDPHLARGEDERAENLGGDDTDEHECVSFTLLNSGGEPLAEWTGDVAASLLQLGSLGWRREMGYRDPHPFDAAFSADDDWEEPEVAPERRRESLRRSRCAAAITRWRDRVRGMRLGG
jgi:hypothetical protein